MAKKNKKPLYYHYCSCGEHIQTRNGTPKCPSCGKNYRIKEGVWEIRATKKLAIA